MGSILNTFAEDKEKEKEIISCDEKTNEITSMPTLLKRLDLKNAIVTWDALNTQKEIVKW
jgi:predicted transposase YbfD/YdcC